MCLGSRAVYIMTKKLTEEHKRKIGLANSIALKGHKEKLVVAIMGQDCEKFIGMCLKSVKDADAIVYCDGGSNTQFWYNINLFEDLEVEVIENEYNQEDKAMNGKQRNFYLKYLKENYKGYWCLVLDADEVVDDLSKVKEFIQTAPKKFLYNIKMRHLIGDLGHEDTTLPFHFVPHRLFYVEGDLKYPETEHPVLQRTDSQTINQDMTTIWHLAYIPGMWDIKKKYENHMKKSQMHPKQFLKQWYHLHLFGRFPRNTFNLIELPDIIMNEFGVDKGEIYYASSFLETKHFVMMSNWLSLTKDDIVNVVDIGCGFGHYGYALSLLRKDIGYNGFDKSKFAIENSPYKSFLSLNQLDATEYKIQDNSFDLVLFLDVLEHLEYDELDKTLKNFKDAGDNFVFSIPWIGNKDLQVDPTHKIKESKEWWVKKLSKYFKIKDAPKDWLFSEQILVGEKK